MKLVIAALVLASACSLDPVDLEGKECPCGAGWRCDFATSQCMLDLPRDGGRTDGGARRDSAVIDSPTGPIDAGRPPDAFTASDASGPSDAGAPELDAGSEPLDAGDWLTLWLEAEDAEITAPMATGDHSGASGGRFVASPPEAGDSTATVPTGGVLFRFTLPTAGDYTLWARVVTPDGGADSFWVQMDTGGFDDWHPGVYTDWTWEEERTYTLAAGDHVLDLRYRESGAGIDKIAISRDPGFAPTGLGY